MRWEERACAGRDGRAFAVRTPRPAEAGRLLDFAWDLHRGEPEVQVGEPDEFALTVDRLAGVLRRAEHADNCCFLGAFAAGEVIGTLWMEGERASKLRHVAEVGIGVRRDWRRQGVARALLASAVDAARASGVLRRLTLRVFESNTAALRLYESTGFRLEGRRRGQVRIGDRYEDDLLMALELRQA